MKVLLSWEQFVKLQGIEDEYNKALQETWSGGFSPDVLNEFLYRLAGKPPHEHYDGHADEYGERCWRIAGNRYSIIVSDLGNGWIEPVGVEIEVKQFEWVHQ